MNATSLDSSNFDATLARAPGPVLVDFWAPWCGPCRMLAPVLDQVAAEQQGRALVAKVNVDQAPELAARYGIRSIPTLIVFRDGRPVERLSGLQPKSRIHAALSAA